jgi:hypothetical protein
MRGRVYRVPPKRAAWVRAGCEALRESSYGQRAKDKWARTGTSNLSDHMRFQDVM